MGFLKKLASLLSGGAGGGDDANAYHLYVRCKACGEPIHMRVDLRNDLSPEWSDTSAYGPDSPDAYVYHKTIIGRERCYKPIDVELRFDRRKQVVSQQATGGDILTEEEYRQALAEWQEKKNA